VKEYLIVPGIVTAVLRKIHVVFAKEMVLHALLLIAMENKLIVMAFAKAPQIMMNVTSVLEMVLHVVQTMNLTAQALVTVLLHMMAVAFVVVTLQPVMRTFVKTE
jgi:hypothetical protein